MKIRALKSTVVITSDVKFDEIARIQELNTDALNLYDDEGNCIYAVRVGSEGSFNKNGICFNSENEDGYAQITNTVCGGFSEDPKEAKIEFLAEYFAAGLQAAEVNLPIIKEKIAEFDKTIDAAKESIQILD